jgi:hypothetical protein
MNFVLEQSTKPHKKMQGVTVEQTKIYKRNETTLSPEDVRKIAIKLLAKARAKNPHATLSIYGTNKIKPNFLLKKAEESIDAIVNKDDYFNGQVEDDSKFQEYYLVNFYINY